MALCTWRIVHSPGTESEKEAEEERSRWLRDGAAVNRNLTGSTEVGIQCGLPLPRLAVCQRQEDLSAEQSFSLLLLLQTPDDTLVNFASVQWTSSVHQVGVSEVGPVAPWQPGEREWSAGAARWKFVQLMNANWTRAQAQWVSLWRRGGCLLMSTSGGSGRTGTVCLTSVSRCSWASFAFISDNEPWTLTDRNARRR